MSYVTITIQLPQSRFAALSKYGSTTGAGAARASVLLMDVALATLRSKHPELAGPPPWKTKMADLPLPKEVAGDDPDETATTVTIKLPVVNATQLHNLAKQFKRHYAQLAAVLIDEQLKTQVAYAHIMSRDTGDDDAPLGPDEDDKGGFKYL